MKAILENVVLATATFLPLLVFVMTEVKATKA